MKQNCNIYQYITSDSKSDQIQRFRISLLSIVEFDPVWPFSGLFCKFISNMWHQSFKSGNLLINWFRFPSFHWIENYINDVRLVITNHVTEISIPLVVGCSPIEDLMIRRFLRDSVARRPLEQWQSTYSIHTYLLKWISTTKTLFIT